MPKTTQPKTFPVGKGSKAPLGVKNPPSSKGK